MLHFIVLIQLRVAWTDLLEGKHPTENSYNLVVNQWMDAGLLI